MLKEIEKILTQNTQEKTTKIYQQLDELVAKNKQKNEKAKLKLINKLITEIIQLNTEEELYDFTGKYLSRFFDDIVILVNQYDSAKNTVTLFNWYYPDKRIFKIAEKILGFTPVGKTFPVDKRVLSSLKSGKFTKFKAGFDNLTHNYLPAAVIKKLKKAIQINEVYDIGLVRDGVLFAGLQFFTFNHSKEIDKEFIETIAHQVSVVIQKNYYETNLIESQQKFHNIFNHLQDAVVIHDLDWNILDFNQAITDLYGYSPEQFSKLSIRDLYAPSSKEEDEMLKRNQIIENGSHIFESEDITKSGIIFPVQINANLIRYNNKDAVIASIRDISQRKQAEKALSQSEQKYRQVVENIKEGIYTVNNGIITSVNMSFVKIFGYESSEELLGMASWDLAKPENRQKIKQLFLKKAQLYDDSPEEVECVKKNGELFWVEIRMSNIQNPEKVFGVVSDITERKKAEDALRKSEKKYRSLIENQGEGIGVVDNNEFFKFANPAAEQIFGVPQGKLTGTSLKEFLSVKDFEFIKKQTNNRQKGKKSTYELDITRPDGQAVNLLVTVTPQYENNSISGAFGIFRDISALKKTENALRISEEKARTNLKNIQLLADTAFHFVDNIFDEDIYQYIAQQLCRIIPDSYVIVNSFNEVQKHLKTEAVYGLKQKLDKAMKVFGQHPVGKIYQVNDRFYELANGKLNKAKFGLHELSFGYINKTVARGIEKILNIGEIHGIAFIIDNQIYANAGILLPKGVKLQHTETVETFAKQASIALKRQKTEKALKKSEARLKRAEKIAKMGHYDIDVNSGKVKWSDETFHIFGLNPKTNSSPNLQTYKKYIIPEDVDKVFNLFYECIEQEKEYNLVYRIKTLDGEFKYLHSIGRYNKVTSHFFGTMQDVSENILKQQKINEQNNKLKQLNVTKDKFFSIIAHDIKNPFSAIINFSELVDNYLQEKNYEKAIKFNKIIHKASQQGLNLLMNLLDWSRVQTGQIKFNPIYFNAQDLANSIIAGLEPKLIEKNITINAQIEKDTEVYADLNMLNTIIRNLLSNAIKYSYPNSEIAFSVKTENDKILFSVKDQGVGIKTESLEKLFRLDTTISTEGTNNETGTGLGLILCKEFVEKHKGTINAKSEYGKGAEFYFTIPLPL